LLHALNGLSVIRALLKVICILNDVIFSSKHLHRKQTKWLLPLPPNNATGQQWEKDWLKIVGEASVNREKWLSEVIPKIFNARQQGST